MTTNTLIHNAKTFSFVTLGVAAAMMLGACDAEPPEAEEEDLAPAGGKADDADADEEFDAAAEDPCNATTYISHNLPKYMRMGVVVGAEGYYEVGQYQGTIGMDIVSDFYHHQMTASRYTKQGGVSSIKAAAGGLAVYYGVTFGFTESVRDWHGGFTYQGYSPGLDLEIPFLGALSGDLGVEAFESPSTGMFGGAAGVGVGASFLNVDLIPAIDFTVAAGAGYSAPAPRALRSLYDKINRSVIPVDVHLLKVPDPNSPGSLPTRCNSDNLEEVKSCYIEFGDESMSHARRAWEHAKGVCVASPPGFCEAQALPMAVNMALGWARDNAGIETINGGILPEVVVAAEADAMQACWVDHDFDECTIDYDECH